MGKTFIQEQNPIIIAEIKKKTHRISKKQTELQRSKKKCFQFFELLKELQNLQDRNKWEQTNDISILNQVSQHIMHFFNFQKSYDSQVLDKYVICLANLLHIIGKRAANLTYEKEFIRKIKLFCHNLTPEKDGDQAIKQRMQAFFYILAVLLHQEKITENSSLRQCNHFIYTDTSFIKLLLSTKLIKDKKISKFYGFVIIHILNQQPSRKIREEIIKACLLNLSKIDHQTTFLNFVTLLRNEKNRTRISLQDIIDGDIVQILFQSYFRYVGQRQSFEILDYFIHVFLLFPPLAPKISQPTYIIDLIESVYPSNIIHPLHQSRIVTFIQFVMKYSTSIQRNDIVNAIIGLVRTKKPSIALKLVDIFISSNVSEQQLIELTQIGYFSDILQGINSEGELSFINQVNSIKLACLKIGKISKSIGQCLHYELICKLRGMRDKIPEGWHEFHDHIEQYLI